MDITKQLLDSWVSLSNVLKNERYVESISYNEIIILRILFEKKDEVDNYIQVKKICDETKMVKSLVNRTINVLEVKNLIKRNRFSDNRKNVYITITEEGINNYIKENKKTRMIVEEVKNNLGEEDTLKFIDYLNKTKKIIERINNNG